MCPGRLRGDGWLLGGPGADADREGQPLLFGWVADLGVVRAPVGAVLAALGLLLLTCLLCGFAARAFCRRPSRSAGGAPLVSGEREIEMHVHTDGGAVETTTPVKQGAGSDAHFDSPSCSRAAPRPPPAPPRVPPRGSRTSVSTAPPSAVFLYGRGGGGHKAAAKALQDCLLSKGVQWAQRICLVDAGALTERAIHGIMAEVIPSGDDVYNWLMGQGWYGLAGMSGWFAQNAVGGRRSAIEAAFADLWSTPSASATPTPKAPDQADAGDAATCAAGAVEAPRGPILVVSFVPFLNGMIRRSLQRVSPESWLVTVITDMENSSAHPWLDDPRGDEEVHAGDSNWIFSTSPSAPFEPWGRHIVVAGNARLEEQARQAGFSGSQLLRTSGMLVHPAFYGISSSSSQSSSRSAGASAPVLAAGPALVDGAAPGTAADPQPPLAVVFFGGRAPHRAEQIARHLLDTQPRVQVALVCGSHEAMFTALCGSPPAELHSTGDGSADEVSVGPLGPRCRVEGFVPAGRLYELFSQASCVIGKPGPGAVAEAGVCGTPFVVERQNIMPQELCVLEHLEQNGFGVVVESLEDLPADLLEQTEVCRKNLAAAPFNRAVFEAAELLQRLMSSAEGSPCHDLPGSV